MLSAFAHLFNESIVGENNCWHAFPTKYIWIIDQDGWILAKSINTQKKERGQYPAILTGQAWPIKDLLYMIKNQNIIHFPCGTKPVSRAGKIASPCPLG